MSEQMEKLVEEIYQELSCVSWGFHRRDAEEIIARIGKAYTDGLPLPNEVGRYPGHGFKADWALDMYTMYEATDYIALRKRENK